MIMIKRAILFFIGIIFTLTPKTANAQKIHIKSVTAGYDMQTTQFVRIDGEINNKSAAKFLTDMTATFSGELTRVILIDSPGGIVDAGESMIRLIEMEKKTGIKVICVAVHDVSSMAFEILTSCSVRLSLAGTRFLVHKISAFPDCKERLTAKYLRRMADQLDKAEEGMRARNAAAMGLTLKDYDFYADREHIWLTEVLYARKYLHGFALVEIIP